MNLYQILYGLCLAGTGLVGGIFYAYQFSVINGLGALSDKEYLMAFQNINREILNPFFFLCFLGSLVMLPLTFFIIWFTGLQTVSLYVFISTLVYLAGVFLVTIFCNVPLNDTLASFDLQYASAEQLHVMRQRFEIPWNKWHLVRTLSAIVSFTTLLVPLLKKVSFHQHIICK